MTTSQAEETATEQAEEALLSWFGTTLRRFTRLYVELVFLAICIRLLGLVEQFIL